MRNWKRWLASVLSVLMLVSALPVGAGAESVMSEDTVIYNLLNREVAVGSDREQHTAGKLDALFDENGDYTIYLEDNALFPYEIQFTYCGKTWVEWFLSPDDTVEISSHTFRVFSERTDPDALVQLGFYVGNNFVLAYPEKKTFSNSYHSIEDTYSLLPLREEHLTLDLQGYFPCELENVTLAALTSMLGIEGTVSAWARWGYYDEDGSWISYNDSSEDYVYVVSQDTKIKLCTNLNFNGITIFEMIVGTGDQLDLNNTRYRVAIYTPSMYSSLKYSAYTTGDTREKISPDDSYACGFFKGGIVGEDTANSWHIDVDETLWTSGDLSYFSIFLSDKFEGVSATVYEGYYRTEDDIPASAVDITNQIWDQKNLSTEGGYLASFTWDQDQGAPSITIVFRRNGETVMVFPVYIMMYPVERLSLLSNGFFAENSSSGKRQRINAVYSGIHQVICDESTNGEIVDYLAYELEPGYLEDAVYYISLRMDDYFHDRIENNGIENIRKAVVGLYASEEDIPEDAEDIKEQLFSDASQPGGGYGADFSDYTAFTIVDINCDLHYFAFILFESIKRYPSNSPASVDQFFRSEGASAIGSDLAAYVMPYDADTYYYNGYQTVFLMNRVENEETGEVTFEPVTAETIIPDFYTGNFVEVYASQNGESGIKQTSGESSILFESGKPVHYTAVVDDDYSRKDYWVTFLTQQDGPKLFVNGTNDESHYVKDKDGTMIPSREIFLTEKYNELHDIFFANIGDETIEGMYVRLENAENITLDDYWTIREDAGSTSLAAFTTVECVDADGNPVSYGELPNVGKIRLMPDGVFDDSVVDISGTLVIGYTGGEGETGEEIRISLTGIAGTPRITTTEIVSGVKYVPYSSILQTNNMYDENAVTFTLESGELPEGLAIKSNGEIYGVPQEAGIFYFSIKATYKGYEDAAAVTSFVLEIKDNSNESVWNATDENYEITDYVGTMVEDEVGSFILTEYRDEEFWTEGNFDYFVDLWLDGERLTRGVDYAVREGSTRITIYEETFEDAGEGSHTISAEFREGDEEDGTLKRAAQNYTVELETQEEPEQPEEPEEPEKPSMPERPDIPAPPQAPENPSEPEEPKTPTHEVFTDIFEDDWFYGDVVWVFEKGLMIGVGDGKFAPYASISQAMVVTTLARMSGIDVTKYTAVELTEVENEQWYSESAIWARTEGILTEEDFSAEPPLERGHFARILCNYLKYAGMNLTAPELAVEFADAADMTVEENEAFQILYCYGIINGVGNGYMDPKGATSRAQLAALLHRVSVFIEAQQ